MREAALRPFAAGELQPGEKGSMERPPPGLARGIFVASPLVVTLLGVALALSAIGFYALGLRRLGRR